MIGDLLTFVTAVLAFKAGNSLRYHVVAQWPLLGGLAGSSYFSSKKTSPDDFSAMASLNSSAKREK